MDLNIPMKYEKDLNIAIDILKKEGCTSIYLFGSLVTGKLHDSSDIDLGIKGLDPKKFYRTCGRIRLSIDNEIDIIDFDFEKDFYSLLDKLGEVVQIG